MNILEIGCGAGGILKYFKEKGFYVEGIDLGQEYIEYGKSKGLNLHCGDINLQYKPDIIIYNHVLEHITDINQHLEYLYNFIDKNTYIFISVPGIKKAMLRNDFDFLLFLQNAHIYYFSLATLKNLMEKNNFKLIKGNEAIMSLFKPKDKNNKFILKNDYENIMKNLKISEFVYNHKNLKKVLFKLRILN